MPDRPGTASIPATTDGASATILYVEKDKGFYAPSGGAAPAGRCTGTDARTGKGINDDRVTVRAARTTEGVAFTDLGVVSGLLDNASTSATSTRYVAPQGTIVR